MEAVDVPFEVVRVHEVEGECSQRKDAAGELLSCEVTQLLGGEVELVPGLQLPRDELLCLLHLRVEDQAKAVLVYSPNRILFDVAMLIAVFPEFDQGLGKLLQHPPNLLLCHHEVGGLPGEEILPQALPIHTNIGPPLAAEGRGDWGAVEEPLLDGLLRSDHEVLGRLPSLEGLAAGLNCIAEQGGYYLALQQVDRRELVIDHRIINTIIVGSPIQHAAQNLGLGEGCRGGEVVGGADTGEGSLLLLAAVLHRVEVMGEVLGAAHGPQLEAVHLPLDGGDHPDVGQVRLGVAHDCS